MTRRILLLVIILMNISFVYGQKIKYKKDLCLIDKTPSFHFNKMDKGEFKSYLITSIKGDTLIEIISEIIELPKVYGISANNDKFHTFKVKFHDSGKTVFFKYSILLVKKLFQKELPNLDYSRKGNMILSKKIHL